MTAVSPDPLAVIAAEPPQLSATEALGIAREHFALDAAEAAALVSERDQNFRLRTVDGRRFVLKIANAAEHPAVVAVQIEALLRVEDYQRRHGEHFGVPRVLRAPDGNTSIRIRHGGGTHTVRVVSYVDGMPLDDREPSAGLCRHAGACLAELGLALHGISGDGGRQNLLWDMHAAPRLRELLSCIAEGAARKRVARALDDFEGRALPLFDTLRQQLIHNDLNPDNLLTDADAARLAGIIDFGDMTRSPLIVDVAVAAAYLQRRDGNPLTPACEFVQGYHALAPLAEQETGLLFDLIRTRLAASVTIRCWRESARRPDDAYLRKYLAETPAEDFLQRIDGIGRKEACAMFRDACRAAGQPLL